jgi:hypothetical protein
MPALVLASNTQSAQKYGEICSIRCGYTLKAKIIQDTPAIIIRLRMGNSGIWTNYYPAVFSLYETGFVLLLQESVSTHLVDSGL